MNYWWVNHGGSHDDEIRGGYLWAPKVGRVFWENMRKVKTGDYIFSYATRHIREIGVVTSDPISKDCPIIDRYDDSGWLVNVSWTKLKVPFRTLSVWEQTKGLFSKCYNSPLTERGKGCQGYLYDINKEIFMAYCDYIQRSCKTDISKFISGTSVIIEPENEIESQIKNGDTDSIEYPDDTEETNFSYERDLQKSLVQQIDKLFPEYDSYDEQYSIESKKIDILLQKKEGNKVTAIELKAGLASREVFGQISSYLGMLMDKFPEKEIKGIIIAGKIDNSLKKACKTNPNIKVMEYNMQITLRDV
jgi:hypothetical protein